MGYNQLDYRLRMDDRVVSLERTNIRYFDTTLITEEVDFISIDVSFISLELVLPVAKEICGKKGKIVALIKPQFEAGKGKVGKGGIVRDKKVHIEVIEKIIGIARDLDLNILALTNSPIKGTSGNIEFLIYLSNSEESSENFEASDIVNRAYESLND